MAKKGEAEVSLGYLSNLGQFWVVSCWLVHVLACTIELWSTWEVIGEH